MICLRVSVSRLALISMVLHRLHWVSRGIKYYSRAVMKSVNQINRFYCNLGRVMAGGGRCSCGAHYAAAGSGDLCRRLCCKPFISFPNMLNIDCFCTQDRSPKTQSQVRRMIEAGQMDRRAPRPPSPPSSAPIDHEAPLCNAPTQNPTVEKCEMESSVFLLAYLTVKAFERVALPFIFSLSLSPPQWKTCGRLL